MIDLTHINALIIEAEHLDRPAERYLAAYSSAEQVALALVAGSGPRSAQTVWILLSRMAPEFGEWAAFFTALGPRVRAVQAGATALITERDAADLARDAQLFLDVVVRWLRRHEPAAAVS